MLARTGSRPRRKPLPQALPRVERLIDLPEQDKQCECGHPLVRIGQDTSEKLDVIPPQVQVIRTVRPKYACHHCEGSGDEEHPAVRIASPPAALIPKGLASEGLLAFIATAKFCDALPLYRQERQFARLGVELSRRTMSDWMIAAATACQALMEALLDKLRCGPILAIDETTVQVLKEQDRANTDTSYVWVARGGPPDEPVVVYRYEPSRAARVAFQIIGDYQGYVQTDGLRRLRAPVCAARHRARGLLGARAARVQGGRRRAGQGIEPGRLGAASAGVHRQAVPRRNRNCPNTAMRTPSGSWPRGAHGCSRCWPSSTLGCRTNAIRCCPARRSARRSPSRWASGRS